MIKGIMFDYGGTIDTNGLHWATVLHDSYERFQIKVPDEIFNKAYAFGEKSLAIYPLVKPQHNFLDVLFLKVKQQFSFLAENGYTIHPDNIELIANDCYAFAKQTVLKATPVLSQLASEFPLIMVSNFYGNLNTVLDDFNIKDFFRHIVESAVVGIRKPDAAIYSYAIDLFRFNPEECIVIGDSFTKDIVPAKQTGSLAIWLNKGKGWQEDNNATSMQKYTADVEITDIVDVIGAISLFNTEPAVSK